MLSLITETSTERVVHVQHKVEENSEGPHINFEPIYIISVNLWRHVVLGAKDSASDIILLFRKAEVSKLVALNKVIITGLSGS